MFPVFLVVLVLGAAAIFFVQNATPVTISFLFFHFESSLGVLVFISVVSGLCIGAAAAALYRIRSPRRKTG